jgi:hypothetical protein
LNSGSQWCGESSIGSINNQAGGGNTPKIEKKTLDAPDERRSFENGKIDVVTVGGLTIGRMTFQPGWKWSKSVKPIVKTNSCQNQHVGFVISGRLKVVLDDGTEGEAGPGNAYDIPPGHDAWVVGDSPWIAFELMSAAQYAKK